MQNVACDCQECCVVFHCVTDHQIIPMEIDCDFETTPERPCEHTCCEKSGPASSCSDHVLGFVHDRQEGYLGKGWRDGYSVPVNRRWRYHRGIACLDPYHDCLACCPEVMMSVDDGNLFADVYTALGVNPENSGLSSDEK